MCAMDPSFLLRVIGPIAAIASLMILMLIAAPVILYVVARWRAARDGVPDGQLGLKFALHYFAMSAFQLALSGASLLIYMLISPSTADKGSGYRSAIGFLIPAGIILAVHLGLLKRTNDEAQPGVRRLFWGYNMIVTGLVACFALVLGFQALFAKGPTGGLGHMAGSMIVVYGTAWAVVGFKFGQMVLGPTPPSSGMSAHPPPPVAPTPPAQTQTGLPSLGGGSFPPIDRP